MAFEYDPNAVNLALQNQGSQYRMPAQQPAPSTPPQAAPAAPNYAQPQARDAEVPGQTPSTETPKPGGDNIASGLQGVQSGASAISSMQSQDANENGGLQKLGGLIGTVLSAYTGNPQGVASGVQTMQGNAQAGK